MTGNAIELTNVTARRATNADLDFIAWCNIEASSPSPEFCYWDPLVAHTGTDTRTFVREVLAQDALAWGRITDFWLIEQNRTPVAGGSAFEMDAQDFRPLRLNKMAGVAQKLGWSDEALGQFMGIYTGVWPDAHDATLAPHAPWILECIAVVPEARGRGVAGRLLAALIAEGCRRGHSHAGISVTNGNAPAERAYEKHGFKLHIQYGADYFDDAYPGSTKFRIKCQQA
jgi:ribosomal protein S18 acetylase RimI-like enzyme